MKKGIFFILTIAFIFGCNTNKGKNEQVENGKIVIYQVLPRLFGNNNTTNKFNGTIEENGVGKFSDFTTTALDSIKSLGCTHIWYTGVIAHATKTDYSKFNIYGGNPNIIKGNAGSPYAIRDYYDVNPFLANNIPDRMAEYDSLISLTHQRGLKVIMDFVPNHVAREYKSTNAPKGVKGLGEDDDESKMFSTENNFYYLSGRLKPKFDVGDYIENPAKATGNGVFGVNPAQDDWYETVKLNYGIDYNTGIKQFSPIPNTWKKMRDILLFWCSKGVDGFRADMAEMVPVEFWEWGIKEVKKVYPKTVFIAEIYNPKVYNQYISQGNFDYLYDKVGLYDTLKSIIQGKSLISAITSNSLNLSKLNSDSLIIEDKLLNFLENHDEQRIASPYFAGDAMKGIPMAIVSACFSKGPFMIYFGQDLGEEALGAEGFGDDDGRTTIFDYYSVPSIVKWRNSGNYDGANENVLSGLTQKQKELHKFYAKLLNLISKNEVFAKGDTKIITPKKCSDLENVFAFVREYLGKKYLCIANFGGEIVSAEFDFKNGFDVFNRENISTNCITLQPYNGRIIEILE